MYKESNQTYFNTQYQRTISVASHYKRFRSMADAVTENAPANGTTVSELQKLDRSRELMPKHVLVKLPSLPPSRPDGKAVFMVHPLEGIVDMLSDIASLVRGAVYGLQCVRDAPLDDISSLARFYLHHVRAVQPEPPYTLFGYSFGAAVAFDMAVQLEQEGHATTLVLVDGSPAFVNTHSTHALRKHEESSLRYDEADLLAYLPFVFYDMKASEVTADLERFSDGEARLARLTELIAATGARLDKETIREAVHSMTRKLVIGRRYKPARLRAPVTLFSARDNFVPLGEDYGLRACAGAVRARQLPGSHRGIIAGAGAVAIAEHVSELLAEH